MDAYNKAATGADALKVNMTVKQIETIDRLTQTAVASGSGPDLIATFGPAQTLNYVGNGNLLPLDPYVAQYGWQDAFLPWALDAGRVDGKLYSLPANLETMAVFYNPATFAQHGWKPPTTLAEFEALCQDAKGKGMVPVGAGNAEWKPATEWDVTWVWNTFAGPTALYEALTGERRWTDPVFVDAINLLKGWFDKGWFGGSTDRYFTNKNSTVYSQLAGGGAALVFNGSWAFAEIGPYFGEAAGNDATWDFAPLPSLGSGVPAGCSRCRSAPPTPSTRTAPSPRGPRTCSTTSSPTRPANWGRWPRPACRPPPSRWRRRTSRVHRPPCQAPVPGAQLGREHRLHDLDLLAPKSDTYIYEQMEKVLVGQLSPQDYCAGLDKVFQEELKAGQRPPVPAPTGA
ncbi:ABC transporter substrate-binding protein [Nonomuraea antimicrobica]